MPLDGAVWTSTSASARLRDGMLKISASRIDGSPSTSMVGQAVNMFAGFETGAAEQSEMNQQLADGLSKASMVRLQNAEVVIESVSDAEITGHFSPGELPTMGGETVSITAGEFRSIVRE